MKKLLVLLTLAFCLVQISQAIIYQGNEVDEVSVSATGDMYIEGASSVTLDASGYAGGSYSLHNAPSNAELKWSIVGPRGYCYPNGTFCSVSLYGGGSYRLVCDVYVDGERIDGVTKYITAMPR